MKLKSLTNVRPVRDLGVKVVAMPPSNTSVKSGSFKLTEGAAVRLGIMKGDYIDLAEHPEQPGTFFIGKGTAPDADGKGRNGSKLGKSGASYTFAAAGAWLKLGEPTAQVEYELSEESVTTDDGSTYIELIKGAVIEKEISAPRSQSSGDEVADAPVQAEEVAGPGNAELEEEDVTSAFDQL